VQQQQEGQLQAQHLVRLLLEQLLQQLHERCRLVLLRQL
jgi:hypothetical protein